MNNVQTQKAEQQGRILGRKIGREISPDEAESVTGGGGPATGVQTITVVGHRSTGITTWDDGGNND